MAVKRVYPTKTQKAEIQHLKANDLWLAVRGQHAHYYDPIMLRRETFGPRDWRTVHRLRLAGLLVPTGKTYDDYLGHWELLKPADSSEG